MKKRPWNLRIKDCIKLNIYTILYIGLILALTHYIFCNWEKCISMQFFSQFDGNNILFLIWIASIFLFFYDVEAKGWKFRRKGIEEANRQIKEKDYERQLKQREEEVNRTLSQISTETNGGDRK